MFHELMKLFLLEPLFLNVFGLFSGLFHKVVGFIDGGFALLDRCDLLVDGGGEVLVEFLLFGFVFGDEEGEFLWVCVGFVREYFLDDLIGCIRGLLLRFEAGKGHW